MNAYTIRGVTIHGPFRRFHGHDSLGGAYPSPLEMGVYDDLEQAQAECKRDHGSWLESVEGWIWYPAVGWVAPAKGQNESKD